MSSTPMIIRHRYAGVKKMRVKAARAHLNAHMKYIEHRSRDQESRDDRRIFDEHDDVINRKDAINDIMNHTSQQDAYYHKVMLSPGPDIPVEDYRQWTRDLMRDLEQRYGQKLRWYAVQHHNTEHAHVHIIVAGAGENRDGQQERVFITPSDYAFLKERGKEHSEFEHQRLVQDTLREIDSRDDTATSHQELFLERS